VLHRPDRPCVIDADARSLRDNRRWHAHAAVLEPEIAAFVSRERTVELAIDRERLRDAPRPNRPFDASNQHRRRPVFRPDDHVEHLVNAVTEIHIPDPAGAIEHLGAAGAPSPGVAREIAFAVVGFRLDDHARIDATVGEAAHEMLAEQPARERNRFFCLEHFRFNNRSHRFFICITAS
jgi:hypothetical protein